MFLVLYYGDIEWEDRNVKPWKAHQHAFNNLDEALNAIAEDFPFEDVPFSEGESVRRTPDPEDDRIVVWEINPGEKMIPVWTFCGWHWSSDDLGLGQGTLPGDDKSLYEIAMGDY